MAAARALGLALPGLTDWHARLAAGGWIGLGWPRAHGGRALPVAAAAAVSTMVAIGIDTLCHWPSLMKP